MVIPIPCNRAKFDIKVTVETKEATPIVICAVNEKKGVYYTFWQAIVNGSENFLLKFPASPDVLTVKIYNPKIGETKGNNDRTFEVTKFLFVDHPTCNIWMTPSTKDFVNFATDFCENLNEKKIGFHDSAHGDFVINYLPVLLTNGKETTSAMRIGKITGIIEVSKKHFEPLTLPMQITGLLHEYSHNYINPLIGKSVEDESAADQNAIYIALGLGYAKTDIVNAFKFFFKDNRSAENNKRILLIEKYIRDFDNGKFAKCNA